MFETDLFTNTGSNPITLRFQLRNLIAHFGIKGVYDEFYNILKDDYLYLSSIFNEGEQKGRVKKGFGGSSPLLPAPVSNNVSNSPITSFIKEDTIDLVDTEVVNTKNKDEKDTDALEKVSGKKVPKGNSIVIVKKEVDTATVLGDAEPTQAKPPFTTTQPPRGLLGNEIKQWQKKQEEKRAADLRAQGIKGIDLLTEENLKKWIETEGRAYAQVARDIVGLPEIIVSDAAKKYGIQSAVAKRRAAIIANRMRK